MLKVEEHFCLETVRGQIVRQLADAFNEPEEVLWFAASSYTEQGLHHVYEDRVSGKEHGRLEQEFLGYIRAGYAAYAVPKRRPGWKILRVLETKRFCWPGEDIPWKEQTQHFIVLSEEEEKGMDMVSVTRYNQTRVQNCDFLII